MGSAIEVPYYDQRSSYYKPKPLLFVISPLMSRQNIVQIFWKLNSTKTSNVVKLLIVMPILKLLSAWFQSNEKFI